MIREHGDGFGAVSTIPKSSKPSNYKEMDDWLNGLNSRQWVAILGAYAVSGIAGVISYIKSNFSEMASWREVDLQHYWNERRLSDFKGKSERNYQ